MHSAFKNVHATHFPLKTSLMINFHFFPNLFFRNWSYQIQSVAYLLVPLFTVDAHIRIVLVKSNQPCSLCSSDFEITYAISHCIVLHLVQLQ